MARSQPTYEELKQELFGRFFCDYACSQPTYEELKPLNVGTAMIQIICSQPTYEELKQAFSESLMYSVSQFPAYL